MKNLIAQKAPPDPLAHVAVNPPKQITLQTILAECFSSPGFVLCATFIDSKKDANGQPLLQHRYLRVKFDPRDATVSLERWKEHVRNDTGEVKK